MILRRIDPRLFQKLLVKVAVGAFEGAHESAFFRPALPLAVFDLVGVFVRRFVVPKPGRFVFQHTGHAGALGDFRHTRNRRDAVILLPRPPDAARAVIGDAEMGFERRAVGGERRAVGGVDHAAALDE